MSKQPRTTKLAFIVKEDEIIEKEFNFDYYGGFAISQKHKTIDAFHTAIHESGKYKILEVSRKSKNSIGNSLSAFNLLFSMNNKTFPLECIYQSSKVFNGNIQFIKCIDLSPIEAKKYIQNQLETKVLKLTGFSLLNVDFPLVPSSIFYDYIYILALSQNKEIANKILSFNCFTDIEFNHKKQFASQARSCAIYKYIVSNDLLKEVINDFHKLEEIYSSRIVKDQQSLF